MLREIIQWLGRLYLVVATLAALVYPSLTDAREKVVLQLRWDHQFQFAGYYAAQWRGYYADAGLDVEIRSAFEPSGKFQNAIGEVVEGRADFGTAGADLLVAVDNGAPLAIVASIFQRSPVAFYARAETGLKSPADLVKLRVGTRPDGIAGVELRAMLKAESIDPALVPLRRIQGRLGIDDIADGLLDVASGFTISADWVAREHGLSLTALYPATYGVDFYGSALITHQRLIENDPELVRRFVTASLKGWKYALAEPEEIADRISRELSRTIPVKNLRGFNRFQIDPVRKLTHFPIVELGHTNAARWLGMHDALKDAGVVKGSFASGDLIFDPERLTRERSDRIAMIVIILLIAGAAAGAGGWIWNVRKRRADRNRADEILGESKQRLQSIADHIPGDVYRRILHRDGRITYSYVSPNLHSFLGLRVDAAIANPQEILDCIHPQDLPAWQKALETSAKDLAPFDVEVRVVVKSGELKWIHSKAQPYRGEDGDIIWDGVALDITDRKKAEENARQHQAELARVLRLGTIGEMATALAHEINQPLAAIYNYSRGCMRRLETGNSSPEELIRVLAQVSQQAERAGKVIRNVADFVRKGEPNLTQVNVNELVQVVAELAQVDLERGRVKPQLQLADDLPPLTVDRIEIEQVILNLVRNGIEAMQEVPARRRTLAIRTSQQDDEEIEIVVSDTGPGVSDAGTKIFDPFFTTKPNGLGMGLAISRTIVEAHHGRLWVVPNVEHGAAFHISLPIRHGTEVHG